MEVAGATGLRLYSLMQINPNLQGIVYDQKTFRRRQGDSRTLSRGPSDVAGGGQCSHAADWFLWNPFSVAMGQSADHNVV